jgi:hypothetical protein
MYSIRALLWIVSMLMLVVPVHAQSLQLEWEGPPGASPVDGFAPLKPAEFLMDANGDGVRDLTMIDADSEPARLVVRSGADPSTRWVYPLNFEIDGKGSDVRFYEVVGDGGLKEAVVSQRQGNRLIGMLEGGRIEVENGVLAYGQNWVFGGLLDYDGDGALELYIGETEKNVMQLWGMGDD